MNLAAAESTASTTYVDLATKDELTINLPAPGDVVVFYNATVSYAGTCASQALLDEVVVDGVPQGGSESMVSAVGAGTYRRLPTLHVVTGLSAGTHLVTIRHRVETPGPACVSTWRNRALIVQPGSGLAHASVEAREPAPESLTDYSSLATPDRVTLELPAPVPVTFFYNASTVGTAVGTWCNGTTLGALVVDGVLRDDFLYGLSDNSNYYGGGQLPFVGVVDGLPAGSHTFDVKTRTDDYCTKAWGNRTMMVHAGLDVAANFVSPVETTLSPTFTDLATPDAVTFSLAEPETVFVFYNASVGEPEALAHVDAVQLDGEIVPGSEQVTTFYTGGFLGVAPLFFPLKLTAGTHTVKVVHRVEDPLPPALDSARWERRHLVVHRAARTTWTDDGEPRVVAATPTSLSLAWSPLHGAASYRATSWDGTAWAQPVNTTSTGVVLTSGLYAWWKVDALDGAGTLIDSQRLVADAQVVMSPVTTWPTGTLVDDFSDGTMDPRYINLIPDQVAEGNGVLRASQLRTDERTLFSIPYDAENHRYIRVALRVYSHRTYPYFHGTVYLLPFSNYGRGIGWSNVFDDYDQTHGSYFTYTPTLDTPDGLVPPATAYKADSLDLQDQWVELAWHIDALTGAVTVHQDATQYTIQTSIRGGKMLLGLSPWGWYTGHYLEIDDLVIESADTPF